MSEDSHDSGSKKQVSETQAGAAESSMVPDVVDASSTDTGAPAEFAPVTIRSYLSEQFGVREVATPVQPAAPAAPPTDAKAELAKWRERVPKLASALRERTEQVGLLESELARLQSEAGSTAGAGLKARDEHISALELKLAGLTTNYQTSEGNLRARELELEDLRSDLQASKQRWQSVTDALDAQVAKTEKVQTQLNVATNSAAEQQAKLDAQQLELTAQDNALSEVQTALAEQLTADAVRTEQFKEQSDALHDAQEQLAGLDERNEKLLETTELANRQLASLSEDLGRLQAELANQEQEFSAKLDQQKQAGLLDIAQIQAEHSERLRDIHAQTVLVFEAVERQNQEEQRAGVAAMQASLELKMDTEYVELQQAAQGLMQQQKRLQAQVTHLQQASEQANAQYADARQREVNLHRQSLADVTLALEAEVWVLQQQLHEQKLEQQQEQQELQAQVARLAAEAQPRVTFLGEISDANVGRSDFEQAWRGLDNQSADETIRELERLLKIRSDELNAALAARVHFLPAATQSSPQSLPGVAPGADTGSSTSAPNAVASLHEQVSIARAENERLRQQLERTSAALLSSDDLTQLKGVGGKMAEQLRELGISQFAQMAALDLTEMESPLHPLHNLRGRIERNGWIEQAKALVHPLTLYGER